MGIDLIRKAKMRSETSVIEYKEIPHKTHQRCELIKDILGLLNAYDLPRSPRFLIYGVSDSTREPVGIDYEIGQMRRDSEYQQLLSNLIEPRPIFEYHDIDAHLIFEDIPEGERWFGFFYFPEVNCETFFRVKTDCQDKPDESSTRARTELCAGQSFVRIGSSTKSLDKEQAFQFEDMRFGARSTSERSNAQNSEEAASIDWRLLLIGKWDESAREDIAFLEQLVGSNYDDMIRQAQGALPSQQGAFNYRNGVWSVANRAATTSIACAQLTSRNLNSLEEPFVEVLTCINDRFNLPSDQRLLAGFYGSGSKYSDSLRKGIAECLAFLANNASVCGRCTKTEVESFVAKVIWAVLGTNDWRVLASAQDAFPLLAEASPNAYLNAISQSVIRKSAVVDLFSQGEKGILESTQYGSSLLLGIAATARGEAYFAAATKLLMSLMDYSQYAAEILEKILLPWRPQTDASAESRKGCVKALAKRGDFASWKVILALIPNATTTTYCLYDPIYCQWGRLPETISIAEFQDISQSYLRDAMTCAYLNDERTSELIRQINAFSSVGMVEEFSSYLTKYLLESNEESRYRIWACIKKCIDYQRAYCDAAWSLSEEQLELLEVVEEEYAPRSILMQARRVFESDDYELIQKIDWESGAAELRQERIAYLEELYSDQGNTGIKGLLALGVKQWIVGTSCALCSFASEIYENALEEIKTGALNSVFAKAFVAALHAANPKRIEQQLESQGWSYEAIAEYYSAFPCKEDIWSLAEASLGENCKLYWQKTSRPLGELNPDQLNHCVTMLNNVGRSGESLQELAHCIFTNRPVDPQVAIDALEHYKPSQQNDFALHFVGKVLEYLEKSDVDKARLLSLEWIFFGVIDNRSDAYIFKALAERPELFVEMISLDCGDKSDEYESGKPKGRSAALQAFSVLSNWRVQPGLKDGSINKASFDAWVEEVASLLPEARHAPAWRRLGASLFHSPSDSDGFFIDRVAADYLESCEEARMGFEMESVNSRGVIWVDETGASDDNLAGAYAKKAEAAEAEGYLAFAATLRLISSDFRRSAQRSRDGFWD